MSEGYHKNEYKYSGLSREQYHVNNIMVIMVIRCDMIVVYSLDLEYPNHDPNPKGRAEP